MSLDTERRPVVIGGHNIGQGTKMFVASLVPEFLGKDVPVIIHNPTGVDRRMWGLMQTGYRLARYPGPARWLFYGDARGKAGLVTQLSNREFLASLKGDEHIVSVHGAFGTGTDRSVTCGDVFPDPLAADAGTTVYVPLPATKGVLKEMGEPKKIEVAGFIVPKILQDHQRAAERQMKFAIGEPDSDDPLQIAFLTTGQFAHMSYLHDSILEDPLIGEWIRGRKAQLTVYTYNDVSHAKKVYAHADMLGLEPVLTTRYEPSNEHGVQVFYNHDSMQAVEDSILAASNSDIVVSELAERVGWTGSVPIIGLIPDRRNRKKVNNTEWARSLSLIGPEAELANFGKTVQDQLKNPGSRLRTHSEVVEYAQAEVTEVAAEQFELFNGAATIAERVLVSSG